MIEYRVYFIEPDGSGRFRKVRALQCPDDASALEEAKKLLNDTNIEVWHLDRMEAQLTPSR